MTLSFKDERSLNAEELSRASEDMPYPKPRFYLLSALMASFFLLTGCGIYNGGFQRGGDLTSNFLERIQENPLEEEDTLLPKKDLK